MADLSKLTDEQLQQVAALQKKQPAQKDLSSLSDEQLQRVAELQKQPKYTPEQTAKIALEKSATLGARPFVAGLGGGLGAAVGTFQYTEGSPLLERIKGSYQAGKEGFKEARAGAVEEQNVSAAENEKAAFLGSLGGALVTAPLTPVKGIMGAAKLGAATGAITSASEGKDAADIAKDTAVGGALGGAIGYLGQKVAAGIKGLRAPTIEAEKAIAVSLPNAATPKQVVDAAQKLGVKPTRGMLATDFKTKGLESTLLQSPSVAGEIVRREVDPVKQKLAEVVNTFTKDQSTKSAIASGQSIQEKISQSVAERYAPIKALYQEVENSAKNIPITSKSAVSIVRNINQFADESLTGAVQSEVKQIAQQIANAQNVNQLRLIRSNVISILKSGDSQKVAGFSPVYEKLDRAINANIVREAARMSKESGQNAITRKAIEAGGEDVIGSLKSANRDYRELITELQDVVGKSGMRKIYGPSDFVDAINELEPNVISDKLFNVNRPNLLKSFSKIFPDEFEVARQFKLADIAENSMTKGNVDINKFIRNVNKIEPEVRSILFGKEVKNIDTNTAFEALKTLSNAIPERIGPSGTPQGYEFFKALTQPVNEMEGAKKLLMYRGGKPMASVGEQLKGAGSAIVRRLEKGAASPLVQSTLIRTQLGSEETKGKQ